jgi:16S rRNA (cytosine967-C5)-methyltransferase
MASRKALGTTLLALDALARNEPLRIAVSDALRTQPGMGPKERRFVAASTREVAQHLRRLDALLAQARCELHKLIPEDRSLVRLLALRLRQHDAPVGQVLRELALPGPRRPRSLNDDALVQIAAALPAELELPSTPLAAMALKHSFPDWLLGRLLTSLPESNAETEAWFEATAKPPTLDLRVNLARAKPAEVLEELRESGLAVEPGRFLSDALVAEDRALLFDLPAFKQGRVEVQDEASQLIARLCGLRSGEKALDACAGAGGKALALASHAPDAEVWATDAEIARLNVLRSRARKAGARIRVVDRSPETWFDVVLVDAPCSGLGALTREPDAKWRLSPESLSSYPERQRAILRKVAPRVRPGGRLVYATCSPLRAEDEDVVEAFLAEDKTFHLAEPSLTLGDELAKKLGAERTLRLWTHRHGTGSFFAALMTRQN